MGKTYIRIADGQSVTDAEAVDSLGTLRPGYSLRVPVALFDGAPPRFSLRDAAGEPVTLTDRDTGQRQKLNTALIAAIEAEAQRCGMSVAEYTKEVLRFSWAQARLSPGVDPHSPAAETETAK